MGNALFDGAVYVDLVNGFVPVIGDSFAVILLTGGMGPRTDFDCFSGLDGATAVIGLSVVTSSAVLESCLVAGNVATSAGGGIHTYDSAVNLFHCTVVENECPSTASLRENPVPKGLE